MSIAADNVLGTEPSHINRTGDAWFLRSSVRRDKAVMLRIDWTTGTQTLVASHEKVDIAGWMTCPTHR
ncbi:MAG TPA: hypothetical protein VKP67_04975 [Xanthobacteraceae bacterium]|nr:hypothetical protein [Xanthobacteraceae bacterium]